MKYTYLIVGGGYHAISCAYHLSQTGAPTLLVTDGELIGGASGANFGCVQVQDCSMGTSMQLTLDGIERVRQAGAELGADIGYKDIGSMLVAENEAQLAALKSVYEEKKNAGMAIKWMDAKEVEAAEPNLAPGKILAATWYKQGRLYPFPYLYAMIRRGKEAGLIVREHAKVSKLLLQGNTCTGVELANGEILEAEQTVVAAGAGTRALMAGIGWDAPVFNIKAECFVSEPLQPFLNNYYSSAAFFEEAHSTERAASTLCIHQSPHGNLLIAETTKPDQLYDATNFDLTSQEHCNNIGHLAVEYFPALAYVQILRSWVTASPSTPTCLPLFGPSQVPGLFLACGFKSSAVLSKIVGEVTRDILTGKEVPYDLSEFTAQVKPIA